MNLLILLLPGLFGAAPAKYVEGEEFADFNKIDAEQRQVLIFQLFNHVTDSCMYSDIVEVAEAFDFEKYSDHFNRFEVFNDYQNFFKHGLLPQLEFFFVYNMTQYNEMRATYQVLYFAKDFDTFYRAACFMRCYSNAGIFVHAFSTALRQRKDCEGIFIPAPFEVYPYFYAYSDTIELAQKMKVKKGSLGIELPDVVQIVVEEGINDVIVSFEDKLRYFTCDINLNAYYKFFRYDFPSFAGEFMSEKRLDRRGEYYFFFYQQFVARYFQEKLSNGMSEISEINFYKPLKYGFYPGMKTHQGFVIPSRSNNFLLANEFNYDEVKYVEAFENVARQAVLNGIYALPNGTTVFFKDPHTIEDFGRYFYEIFYSGSKYNYYDYFDMIMREFFFSGNEFTSFISNVFDVGVQDSAFYMFAKHLTSFYTMFKKFVPAYTAKELIFVGVKIENFNVDKLVTFFEYYDMDMSNAMFLDNDEFKSTKESAVAYARKRRLNHKPFSFDFEFMSDKAADSVVRIFLGPKYDFMGNEYNLQDNYLNFVEFDSFPYKLKVGKNSFVRTSKDFNTRPSDSFKSRDFYKSLYDGDSKFSFDNEFKERCMMGFPDNLLLPKGTKGGFEMRFFVIISPANAPEEDFPCDKFRSTYCFDNRAFGFPFDRFVDETQFYHPNMLFKDVFIFQKD